MFPRLLFVICLATLTGANPLDPDFEESDTEYDLRSHHSHHDSRGFHAKVTPDVDSNGFSYSVTTIPNASVKKRKEPKYPKDPYSTPASRDLPLTKNVITGIPDLSDPCFRRYSNSIIVNAQPYERRSSISLQNCKIQCLKSQVGVYSCRSFVYDNLNQVCDLFAHVGDQSPARLLRFQTRDYFEPTAAISCNADALILSGDGSGSRTESIPELPTPAPKQKEQISSFPEASLESSKVVTTKSLPPIQSCEPGKAAKFLRTNDFELFENDDFVAHGVSLDECLEICERNTLPNKTSFACSSFEYARSKCVLSVETAVPLGNGRLKQSVGTDYYEKICVEEKVANDCPSVYNRFPQQILVGFAETVVDASSLQQCFDYCLNSKKIYGFKCISGMYYFEESQLNCILNTENRFTQPDLFTNESSDLVDYFETGCNGSSDGVIRRFASPTSVNHQDTSDFDTKHHDFVDDNEASGWSEWSACDRGNSLQQRTKTCAWGKICGHESRPCTESTENTENTESHQRVASEESQTIKEKLIRALRRSKCRPNVCCKIFDSCQFGVIQFADTKKYEYCTNPC